MGKCSIKQKKNLPGLGLKIDAISLAGCVFLHFMNLRASECAAMSGRSSFGPTACMFIVRQRVLICRTRCCFIILVCPSDM